MSIAALGGRRFVFATLVLGACSVLLAWGKLTDGSYCAIVLACVGGIIAGHTAENIQNIKTAGQPAQPER